MYVHIMYICTKQSEGRKKKFANSSDLSTYQQHSIIVHLVLTLNYYRITNTTTTIITIITTTELSVTRYLSSQYIFL